MASLRSLVESALVTALSSVTTNVYAGFGTSDKALPCVICRAVSAEDVVASGGRYIVTCHITTKDNAGSSSTFDDISQSVKVLLDSSTLITSLTSSSLYVYGFAASSSVQWDTDGDAWMETRTIQIECAPLA